MKQEMRSQRQAEMKWDISATQSLSSEQSISLAQSVTSTRHCRTLILKILRMTSEPQPIQEASDFSIQMPTMLRYPLGALKQSHRITECSWLEGMSEEHLVQHQQGP